MSDLLLALGIAALAPSMGFSARWLCSTPREHHWSGWAATASFTAAIFGITLGNLIR